MAATSVTGKGLGSADKKQKGSEHLRIGAEKILGPRVVYANKVTLDGSGNKTIVLPKLSGVVGDYIVIASHADTTAPAAVAASLAFNANDTTVTVKGAASDDVFVAIMKKGLAV